MKNDNPDEDEGKEIDPLKQFESFEEILDKIIPVLYYETDPLVEKGKLIRIHESELNPEYVVFHPEELEFVRQTLILRFRLVHISEEPPDVARNRVMNFIHKLKPTIDNTIPIWQRLYGPKGLDHPPGTG